MGRPSARLGAVSRARVTRAAGAGALAALAALGLVRGLAEVPSGPGSERLPEYLAGPLEGLGIRLELTTSAAIFAGMVACYLVLVACGRSVPRIPALAVLTALLVLFTLTPPRPHEDLFSYIAYARAGTLHHANPYVDGAGAVGPADPVASLYAPSWRHLPSKYGPLFTLLTYATTPLGVAGAAWALKLLAGAAAAALLGLVAVVARRLGRDPVAAVLFVGLNPLVFVYAVGHAHNDLLMVAALVAGVAALAAGREALGAGLGVLSAAIKPASLLAVPFLVLGARSRRRALAGAALATLAALATTALAFGLPARLVRTLLSHVEGSGYWSVPGLAGRLLGVDLVSARTVLLAAFVLAYAILIALAATRRLSAVTAAGWAMAATLALSAIVLEWYLAWLLPLAALGDSRRLRWAALGLTVAVSALWPVRHLL